MQIRSNVEVIREKANTLRTLLDEYNDLYQRMNAAVVEAGEEWEGAAQQSYLGAWDDMKPTMTQQLPEYLQTNADNLQKTADNFEAADQEMASQLR